MKLIVGLGNFGDEYSETFHNMGFMCVERLARRHDGVFKKHKCSSDTARITAGGESVLLAKPLTYMNNSGCAVAALKEYYDLTLDDILVVTDDLDLERGSIRYRPHGSGGTHNGMRDIVSRIGEGFARVRIGIGPKPSFIPLVDFVLSKPTNADMKKIDVALDDAVVRCEKWLEGEK